MRRAFWQFGKLFRKSTPKRLDSRRPTCTLRVETLEDRLAPAVTGSSIISGNAYIDYNGSGAYNPADFGVPGVVVYLTGTTSTGNAVNQSTTTNGGGTYSFQNVLPGTYTLAYTSVSTVQGDPAANNANAPGMNILAAGLIDPGQTLTNNIGFDGLTAPSINLQPFFTFSTGDYPFGSAGGGLNDVNYRSNSVPYFMNSTTPTVNGTENGTNVVDLDGYFNDPDIQNGTTVAIATNLGTFDIVLFDEQARETVQNFLDYVESGDYNTSIFHRLVSGFVLQGGGFTIGTSSTPTVSTITTLPDVPSEAPASLADGNSNTIGTIAMALPGSDPNGGTDNFFINLTNNNSSTQSSTSSGTNLDAEDFTVFGDIVGGVGTGTVVNSLTTDGVATNESSANGAFSQIPLVGGPSGSSSFTTDDSSFPTDATDSNFEEITSAAIVPGTQNESLSYSLVSYTNQSLFSSAPTFSGSNDGYMTLNYASGQTGSATITVEATDMFGATTTGTFTVNVGPAAPTASGVTISTNNNSNVTTLTANATLTGSPNTTYQWFQTPAGSTTPVAIGSATTSNTLSLTGLTVTPGEQFTVAVTPADGTVSGATVTSKSVTIGSPTAVVTGLSIAPNSTTNTTSLTVTPTSSDSAGDTVSYTYQWFQNGVAITTTNDPGETSANTATLDLTQLSSVSPQDQFTVDVTPSDALGAGATAISNAVSVATTTLVNNSQGIGSPSAVITNLTVNPDFSTNPATLTVTPTSTDASGDTVNYAYQWFQNGVAITTTNDPGETSANTATLELGQLAMVNRNDQFTVQVTPSDATGNGPTVTSETVVYTSPTSITGSQGIGSPSAVITSLSVGPNSTSNATSLTVTPTSPTDPNGSVTYSYQWFQNGMAINDTTTPSANTATLELSQLSSVNVNDEFTVQVTPSDTTGMGAAITSQPVTVSSTTTLSSPTTTGIASTGIALATPAVTNVTIAPDVGLSTPPNPSDLTTLTATPAGNDDGLGTVTYTYTWSVTDTTASTPITTPLTVGTSQTLTLSSVATAVTSAFAGDTLDANAVLTLTVTPSTGAAFTTAALPLTVTANSTTPTYALTTPPTVTSVSIAANGTVLTAAPTGGTATSFTYQWMQNGSPITGATSSTLNVAAAGITVNPNDAFAVVVTPQTTGTGTTPTIVAGAPVNSNNLFVTETNNSANPFG